jgi:uncharacterized protein
MTNPDISPVPPGLPVTREQIFGFCHKYHITSFVFFGSAVRGTLRPDSDIDIMVTYDPDHPHTFSVYLDMIHELEDIFGRKVDLVDRNQIAGTRNYLRRIGMLENLLPTHRQESYLLDILLFLEELALYPADITPKGDIPDDRTRQIHRDGRWYCLLRIARIAEMVDPVIRSRLSSVPWALLDRVREHDILDEPDPSLIDEVYGQLSASVPDLQAAVPDEEKFLKRVRSQGFW